MGNGSGPGRFNSKICNHSWGYQNTRSYFPEYIKQLGPAFYGLSIAQYQSTMYYMLSNNGPGAGARCVRFGTQSNFNNIQFGIKK